MMTLLIFIVCIYIAVTLSALNADSILSLQARVFRGVKRSARPTLKTFWSWALFITIFPLYLLKSFWDDVSAATQSLPIKHKTRTALDMVLDKALGLFFKLLIVFAVLSAIAMILIGV